MSQKSHDIIFKSCHPPTTASTTTTYSVPRIAIRLFTKNIVHQTHEYLGGIIRGLGAKPEMIGGVSDHVHLLIGQKTTHCPADLVREIKKASTDWLRLEQPDFSWQEGYGVFSVSPERLDAVSKYIAKQPSHHATKTYREEWIELLKYARIEFDESQFD